MSFTLSNIIYREPKTLEFSESSRYILSSRNNTPTVVEVPASIFSPTDIIENVITDSPAVPQPSTKESSSLTITHMGNSDITKFGLRPGGVVANVTAVKDCNDKTMIIDTQAKDEASVRLSTKDQNGTSHTLELVTLPKEFDIQHTNSTVVMPKTQDDYLRIILNPEPHTEYSMSSNHHHVVPTVVERDQRLIKHSIIQQTGCQHIVQ